MATRFTVAIPTHDRRETALLAVRSVLAQTRPPEQLIVLCDGCSDGTADAVSALGDDRATALELPKLPGYAYDHRNRALELACGDVITWLGDDDLLLPDHLERIGEYWDAGAVDLVGAANVIVAPDDGLTFNASDWSMPANREELARHNTSPMASVSVRVELARAAGGWDGSQPRAGDWDLWKRVLAAGARPAMTAEPTVLHFKATGRDQAWASRVQQNAAWLERMASPAELTALRHQLRRARAEHEAWMTGQIIDFGSYTQALEAQAAELRARVAALEDQLAAVARDGDGRRHGRAGAWRRLLGRGR